MRRWHWIALAIVAMLFAAFVWPTRYIYTSESRPTLSGGTIDELVRIDRFTGDAEYVRP